MASEVTIKQWMHSTLVHTLEMQQVKGGRVASAFLDIKKAFDLVDRKISWQVLDDLDYGGKIVKFFMEMYKDTSTTVELGGVQTTKIPVEVGLKQGCVLSPMLFSLYLQELGEELMAS